MAFNGWSGASKEFQDQYHFENAFYDQTDESTLQQRSECMDRTGRQDDKQGQYEADDWFKNWMDDATTKPLFQPGFDGSYATSNQAATSPLSMALSPPSTLQQSLSASQSSTDFTYDDGKGHNPVFSTTQWSNPESRGRHARNDPGLHVNPNELQTNAVPSSGFEHLQLQAVAQIDGRRDGPHPSGSVTRGGIRGTSARSYNSMSNTAGFADTLAPTYSSYVNTFDESLMSSTGSDTDGIFGGLQAHVSQDFAHQQFMGIYPDPDSEAHHDRHRLPRSRQIQQKSPVSHSGQLQNKHMNFAPSPDAYRARDYASPHTGQPSRASSFYSPSESPSTIISRSRSPADQVRTAQDHLLVEKRNQGMSYKDIKQLGGFSEAVSTLRGRYRTLTKEKNERVRKPEWTDVDVQLLRQAADILGDGDDPYIARLPWSKISEWICDHGGSYKFGSATCHKKWKELKEQGGI